MSLTIHRMHTRLRTASAVAPHRLAAWQDEFRHQDGERIAARWTGPEEWLLIRRLPLRLRWREDPADADVGRAWGDALSDAIARALDRDDGNCVRYTNRQAALADLVYRAALGDSSRHWAWQRMELIPRAALRSDEVLRHAGAELACTPELVWPVITRLLAGEESTACLTAALRALPQEMWLRWVEACPRSAGFARALAATRSHVTAASGTALPAETAWNAKAQSLLRWAAARGWFVQRHRDLLTVLLCACQEPTHAATESSLQRQLAAARRTLAALLPATAPGAVPPPSAAPAQPRAVAATTASPSSNLANPVQPQAPSPVQSTPAQRRLPELPQPQTWLATRFAGALFWLSRIAAAGALKPPEEGEDALPLFLRELALALGVPSDDPVLPAFCGGALPAGEASAATIAAAQQRTAEWERWLATVAREPPVPRVLAVCRRDGRLRVEPGWIELHLPLSSVETAIRRLGLDLDPGWLPWLGCVVRIIYEET